MRNRLETIDPELVRTLEDIYQSWEHVDGFPTGSCEDVALELTSLGLSPVDGFFLLDRPLGVWDDSRLEPHMWVEDSIERRIDLTAHQFNAGLNRPIRPGVLIVEPGDPLYKRYILESDIERLSGDLRRDFTLTQRR